MQQSIRTGALHLLRGLPVCQFHQKCHHSTATSFDWFKRATRLSNWVKKNCEQKQSMIALTAMSSW